jgi:hypothetical protein
MKEKIYISWQHVHIYKYMEKGTNGKWQLPTVCCKRKTELANFRLFAANRNGKGKFVFLGRQMITGDR